jgi:hypothetical protein
MMTLSELLVWYKDYWHQTQPLRDAILVALAPAITVWYLTKRDKE